MTNNKLGLPLDYKKLPEYFDALNVSHDTDSKNDVIEQLLRKHKVNTVLDLTCGTGSQVFFLTKLGYKVVGADFSPALLELARKKAREQKLDIKFIDGDMRTVRVGKFDAVITIFNAIGHLTKAGFEKALKNIYRNLKDGGIYVFDIFNLDSMTDNAVAHLAMNVRKRINDTQILAIQNSTIDRRTGRLTSYDSIMIQKNADKPKIFNNKFTLQIYTAHELKEILARNGFETIAHYAIDGSKFIQNKSTSILTVAKKQ